MSLGPLGEVECRHRFSFGLDSAVSPPPLTPFRGSLSQSHRNAFIVLSHLGAPPRSRKRVKSTRIRSSGSGIEGEGEEEGGGGGVPKRQASPLRRGKGGWGEKTRNNESSLIVFLQMQSPDSDLRNLCSPTRELVWARRRFGNALACT
jgi:hypothetical protein